MTPKVPYGRLLALLLPVFVFLFAGPIYAADPPPERENEASAALALATAKHRALAVKVRTDEQTARADALKLGRPLVLFVGETRTKAKAANAAGAISVAVPRYDSGEGDPAKPRVILLTPKDARDGFTRSELPADVSPTSLAESIKGASPKAPAAQPAALNWTS